MATSTNPHTYKNIDLDKTELVGVFYQGPSEDERDSYRSCERETLENLELAGFDWDSVNFHNNGGCAACGASFFHGGVVIHDGTPIAIGGTCASKFGIAKAIGKARQIARNDRLRSEAKRENLQSAERQLLANPGLSDALTTKHDIVEDIAEKLFRYGSLSDKQIELVFKIAEQEKRWAAEKADREAKLADAPALTEERQEIEGLVISTKARDGYAYGTTEYKMTVLLDNGNRVWGTIPNAIFDEVWGNTGKVRVTFTATICVSENDEHFGFFKRPTKPSTQEVSS